MVLLADSASAPIHLSAFRRGLNGGNPPASMRISAHPMTPAFQIATPKNE
jgi:hypothetical protein